MRRYVFIIVLMANFAAPSAVADAKSSVREVVAAFDELVSCSQKAGFSNYGLSSAGPCGGWVKRVEALRKNDLEVIRNGYACTAGDVRIAGNSLVFGDREHFEYVRDLVEECRNALG